MEKIALNLKNWIRENPAEFCVLLAILILGAFCRLYKIDQYMTFLGDEGRDAIIVRRIFTELHPPLIGPGTSIGNMYLGPLYYYMMALPLLIAGFSPVGPAIMIAVLGVVTIAFVWWVGRVWFDKMAGIVAAGLYAISPVVIYYSRSSWNPNIMPFFALLSIYSIWNVWKKRRFRWLIVMAISYAFVLQSHYLGLLLAPTLFIFWLLTFLKVKNTSSQKSFIMKSIISFLGFLILMSPLFFFDIRHNWMNIKAIYTFFTIRQTTVSIKPWTAIPKLPLMLNLMDNSVLAAKNMVASLVVSATIILCIIWIFFRNYFKKRSFSLASEYWLILSWLAFGLIGLGLYKQNIYDHYFGFIFAVPFILIGIFISKLLSDGKLLKILGAGLLIYLVIINLINNPLRKQPNNLLGRSVDVSKIIEKESSGQPFNLAVIAENNYEAGYEYFLLKDGYPVMEIDSQKQDTITNQLFAVCELIPTTKCDPIHNPKAQVANFGWSKIDQSWEIDGVIIYRLVHST